MSLSTERAMRELRLQQIKREAADVVAPSRPQAQVASGNGATAPRLHDGATAESGYYGMPLLKTPAWTWEVPLYFFVGGAAGTAAMLANVGRLTGADRRLVRDARWMAAIGGVISPPLLISDLGVPSRFLHMLRVFKVQSPMSLGSWTLMAFSSTSCAAAVLAELEMRRRYRPIPILTRGADIASALTGLMLATYTGVLIGATAIPAWNEEIKLLPIHFATSGLSSAVSVLELRGHRSSALNKIGIGATAVESAIGAALEITKKPGTQPVRRGLTGWTMRVAGLMSGPLPLALRLLSFTTSRKRGVQMRKAADVISIAGSLITRWAWVYAGRTSSKDPTVPLQLPSAPRPDIRQIPSDK